MTWETIKCPVNGCKGMMNNEPLSEDKALSHYFFCNKCVYCLTKEQAINMLEKKVRY